MSATGSRSGPALASALALLEAAADGAFVADGPSAEASILVATAGCRQLFGGAELGGRTLGELFIGLPEVAPAGGGVELQLRTDGPERWAVLALRPAHGRWVGVLVDCTARRQADADRERLARLHQALTDAAGELALVLDQQGCIRLVGRQGALATGHAPESLLGRPALEFVHPEDRPRAAERMRAVLSGPRPPGYSVYRLRLADGSFRPYESLATRLPGEDPAAAIALLCRDVSDRERAAAAEAQALERLRVATRAARVGVFEWDPASDELLADEATRALVRQAPDQAWTGFQSFLQRIAPEDQAPLREATAAALHTGQPLAVVFRVLLAGGGRRWVYLYAQYRHGPGAPVPRFIGVLADVSEQREAEAALDQERERGAAAAWAAGIGLWEWWPQEGRERCDARTAELTGFGAVPREYATADRERGLADDDRARWREQAEAVLCGASDVVELEYRSPLPGGGRAWRLDRGRVIERLADGRPARVLGVTIDVDARKRAELEAIESRLQLDLALKSSQLGIWDWRVEQRQVYLDDRALAVTGLARAAADANPNAIADALDAADREPFMEAFRRVIAGADEYLDVEVPLLPPGSAPRAIQLLGYVTARAADGRPLRMTGTLRDVTVRRRTLQLLEATQQLAQLGGFELQLATGECSWTQGARRVLGLPADFKTSPDAILGMVLPRWRARLAEAMAGARDHGRPFDLECELRRSDGATIWVRMMARAELFDGRVARVDGVIQDITARKQLEAELVEVASREQQRLGHELHDGLGQELAGLSMMLEAVRLQFEAAHPALGRELERLTLVAARAVQSARHIAHGLAPVSAQRGGLGDALRKLAASLQGPLHVGVAIDPACDDARAFDEVVGNQLFRIAQEAVSNAIRHGRPRRITLRLWQPGADTVELAVEDDGRGIPAAALRDPGFGLRSMAWRSAAIGATLEVGAAEGGGTEVRVTIPAAGQHGA